jgi:hypothetical protein
VSCNAATLGYNRAAYTRIAAAREGANETMDASVNNDLVVPEVTMTLLVRNYEILIHYAAFQHGSHEVPRTLSRGLTDV